MEEAFGGKTLLMHLEKQVREKGRKTRVRQKRSFEWGRY